MAYLNLQTVTKIEAAQTRYGQGSGSWEVTKILVTERDFYGNVTETTVALNCADPDLGAMIAKAINAAVSEHRSTLEEKAA